MNSLQVQNIYKDFIFSQLIIDFT